MRRRLVMCPDRSLSRRSVRQGHWPPGPVQLLRTWSAVQSPSPARPRLGVCFPWEAPRCPAPRRMAAGTPPRRWLHGTIRDTTKPQIVLGVTADSWFPDSIAYSLRARSRCRGGYGRSGERCERYVQSGLGNRWLVGGAGSKRARPIRDFYRVGARRRRKYSVRERHDRLDGISSATTRIA